MVMIKLDGTFETYETGTTTGEAQVLGTTTVAGTKTTDDGTYGAATDGVLHDGLATYETGTKK